MAGPRDDHGIAGLNAMIMFIALTLAGSIIATIIIASMVEVMRESKSDAQKSQFALYGKVMVIDAHITKIEKSGDEIEEALISVTIELSPGSTTLQDQQLLWTVICPNEVDAGDPRWSNNGNFGSATDMTGNGNNPSSVDVIEPGKPTNYSFIYFMIMAITQMGTLQWMEQEDALQIQGKSIHCYSHSKALALLRFGN